MEERSRGLRGEIKSTQAKEENRRLMRDLTGADNAKEHHKFMIHHKFMRGKREDRRRPMGKLRVQLVLREKIKCMREKF